MMTFINGDIRYRITSLRLLLRHVLDLNFQDENANYHYTVAVFFHLNGTHIQVALVKLTICLNNSVSLQILNRNINW